LETYKLKVRKMAEKRKKVFFKCVLDFNSASTSGSVVLHVLKKVKIATLLDLHYLLAIPATKYLFLYLPKPL
jgi:hypothetical protein